MWTRMQFSLHDYWLHSEIPDTEDLMLPEARKTEQRKLKKTVTILVTDDN